MTEMSSPDHKDTLVRHSSGDEGPAPEAPVIPYDENLLERARTQWQFGDWPSLVQLKRDTMQHHPDRAKLALLAAAGHMQCGSMDQARRYVCLARDWGCDKKLVNRILIAGVHNSLGRASALATKQPKALEHFENSIELGARGNDARLLRDARAQHQYAQLGLISVHSHALPSVTMQHAGDARSPHLARSSFYQNNLLRHARRDIVEPLEKNFEHQFAARHALCHYITGSIYTFIPKNGCTTLRYSLALANKCINGPADFKWIHKNNDTFKATLQELVNAPYTFVVLRCPYARLASVYLDKIVNNRDVDESFNKINVSNKRIEEISFRDFLNILSDSGAVMENHHWTPQVSFLVYDNYTDWFRLEKFSEVTTALSKKIGLTVVDTRNIAKHGLDQYELSFGDFSDTPAKEITIMQSKGFSPDHASLYNKQLLELASELYAEDVALYKSIFGASSLENDSPVLSRMDCQSRIESEK